MTTSSRFAGKAVGGSGSGRILDATEAHKALTLLADPSAGCQLTEIPTGRNVCLPGDDLHALVEAARGLMGGRWLYLLLSPVAIGLDRPARKADILRRRWLTVDVDAVRPDTSVMATEEEHQGAAAGVEMVVDYLTGQGWPFPVVIDSGNGFQALYEINLPNDAAAQALLGNALRALALLFEDELRKVGATMDATTFKATQSVKLPGSWACKGPNTPERPWRPVRIVSAPEVMQTVSVQLLMTLAAPLAGNRPPEPVEEAPATPPEPKNRFAGKAVGSSRNGGPHPYAAKVLRDELASLASTSEGKRNDQAYKSAAAVGNYVESGHLYLPEVRASLIHAAVSTGLPEREAVAAIDRGLTDGQANPKLIPEQNGHDSNGQAATAPAPSEPESWPIPIPLTDAPPVPAFPLDVLPLPLARFAQEAAWATSAPPDFVAVPMLAVAAAATGNARWLAVTRTHRQPPCLFAAVVARPGAGKSAPFGLAIEPLELAERQYYRQWDRDRKAAGSGEPIPKLRRCLLDDTTTEGMIRILTDNQRGLLRACDELSALVTGMNQYKDGGKGNDRQSYLKVWSGATIKVDRKQQEGIPLVVRRPLVCIVGGIQPQVIEWLRGEQKGDRPPPDDGFLDRFLLSYPAELPAVGERWRDVSDQAANDWRSIVEYLLSLDMEEIDGDPVPKLVPLAADGKVAWERLTQEHADELNAGDFPDWMRGHWSKLVPGYAGRLALVLHLLRWAFGDTPNEAVDGESVVQAFRLIAYFKAHAHKVYAAMGADPRVKGAQQILSWLTERPAVQEFSRRDVYVDLRRSFNAPEALGAPLWLLVQHNYIRDVAAPERSGPGRRPTQKYQVNPLWERHKIQTIQSIEVG